MRLALHNSETLHVRIDLAKLRRIEDDALMAADGLHARFERYRARIDAGKALHREAIYPVRNSMHAYVYLPFPELAALSAADLEAAGISPALVARAVIEFDSAAALYADYQRQSVTVGRARNLLERLRQFTETVPG
jgi:hypothetical protein